MVIKIKKSFYRLHSIPWYDASEDIAPKIRYNLYTSVANQLLHTINKHLQEFVVLW